MKTTFFLLFNLWSLSFGQRANFCKEDITFRLDSVHLDVEGYYWFSNDSNKSISTDIFYPFPSAFGDKIDSIRIYNLSAGQNQQYKMEGNSGISFYLFIAPHDTAIYQIGYRQKLISDSAIYLLKTTQAWGKPLTHAEYKLLIPDSFAIKYFSYPPMKSYEIQNKKIYYWEMDDFMPTRDMIFCF